MGKLFSTAIVLLMALIMAGCSSSSNIVEPSPTISGTVRIPSAVTVAPQLAPSAIAADIGGLTPAGAGVTVELVRVNNQGNTTVLAITTTDSSGAYSFSGPDIPTPNSDLAVLVVNGPGTNVRALVSGNQVDVSPASEVVYENVLESGLGVNLQDLSLQELAAFNYLLLGMGIDVSGLSFDNAVSTIKAASGNGLAILISSYAETGTGVNLQDYFYNTITTNVNLLDPFSLAGASPGGISLSTRYGGGTIGAGDVMVKGSQEAIISPILHDLTNVTQSGGDPNRDIVDLEGLNFALNPHGQVIVWGSDGNGVLGIAKNDASLMVYPETSNTPVSGAPYAALSRGIRIQTAGNTTFGSSSSTQIDYVPSFLDPIVGGTAYHLFRLSQTLSSLLAGANEIVVGTAQGDLTFDSTATLTIEDDNGQPLAYASFAANTLTTDTLSLDLDTDTAASATGTDSIGGAGGGVYNVNPFSGNLTFRDNDGSVYPYVGLGMMTKTGEIFTLANMPDDNAQQATNDGTGTHDFGVAVRQTPAAVSLTPGTYNVLQYAYYLSGDPLTPAASVTTGYSYGTLTLDADGTTVSGGSLIANRAKLDVVTAKQATADALTALPSATPETTVSGSIAAPAADGTLTLSLTIGGNTVTGSGAVTANGDFIVAAVKIADGSATDIGRGLLFLMRRPG